MKITSFLRGAGFAAILALTSFACAQILPTGATITPTAAPGSVFVPLTTSLPDFPTYTPDGAETTAISPDGNTLLILTSGYNLMEDSSGNYTGTDSGEFVFVYDISTPSTPVEVQVVFLSDFDETFDGIVWAPDESAFYVGGGGNDNIHTFTVQGGQWAELGTPINLGHYCDVMCEETEVGPTAAILGITPDGNTLFVANHETDSVTSVNLVQGVVQQEYDLRPGIINPAQTGVPGGEFPYGIAVAGNSASGTVYVSSVRDREIDVLNLTNGVLTLANRIPVAGNPEKMILNAAQTELFVVAANSDELIIINTAKNKVVGQVNVSAPAGILGNGNIVPKGSNPNSVTLSPDETTAYVTTGGTNSVSVVSLTGKTPVVQGLIPTGWYPNSVSVSPDGSTLYVVNSKSVETPNPVNCRYINNDPGGGYGSACQTVFSQDGAGNQYAWQNEYSGFLILPVPTSLQLSQLTAQVAQNNGFNFQLSPTDIATMTFLHSHIQHIIYIVKENRTFDQILGDLTNGANADPDYTQFPAVVTPNFHALATNFVTFDNFDDSSMVSMDGWQWSTAARALDMNEKCVKVNYGKGGCQYDSEGTARNVNVAITGLTARQKEQPIYPPDPNLLPGNANEVEADGPTGKQGAGVLWGLVEERKRGVEQVEGRERGVRPTGLRDVEGIGHRRHARVMHAQLGHTQDFLDRPKNTDRGVGIGDDRTLLHIRSNDESKTAVAADVVGAILGIVFDDEDESVVGIGAVCDLIHRLSYRVVVVGNLKFGRVHAEAGGAEVAEMVMIVAQENQVGEFVGLNLLVEFALPLFVAEEIGVALIEGPEAGIGEFEQFLLRRPLHLGWRLCGARIGESGTE